jgi:hypothetical protein
MLQSLPTLDSLPYEKVIDLINFKAFIDNTNDIKARTRLFRTHPELFDKSIVSDIKMLHKAAIYIGKKRQNGRVLFMSDYKTKTQ